MSNSEVGIGHSTGLGPTESSRAEIEIFANSASSEEIITTAETSSFNVHPKPAPDEHVALDGSTMRGGNKSSQDPHTDQRSLNSAAVGNLSEANAAAESSSAGLAATTETTNPSTSSAYDAPSDTASVTALSFTTPVKASAANVSCETPASNSILDQSFHR